MFRPASRGHSPAALWVVNVAPELPPRWQLRYADTYPLLEGAVAWPVQAVAAVPHTPTTYLKTTCVRSV